MQVKGVKGPSWLSCLPFIDIVDGMSADYMHAVLLGVVKLLFTLWFETSRCRVLPCDMRSKEHLINSRIEKIHPPSEITHGPRDLTHQKNWKGSITGVAIISITIVQSYTVKYHEFATIAVR